MCLTLTLPPKIEALLRQRAENTGQDIASIALAVLAFGLSFDRPLAKVLLIKFWNGLSCPFHKKKTFCGMGRRARPTYFCKRSDESDFFEALEGIQRGLDDFEQGQFSSLEEFIAEQNRKYGFSLEV
ncbi:MAG: hypothetical protein JGK21_31760 [Microcoleus sp. PH2017_22_RUC_O_B]|uniref:hypothetical protein n=1 Tax=unclassified Microcoleus TaxID=2642155 RepID=UPI001DB2056B|nr:MULTISPECIES: hypothetical protein [unclassified Microcoleus]MCC3532543.1 hypothetical protein [Microcoleus sp. PH2017_21_RUC_O_A]MCC3544808.1 hypothetical protein [Microcoleus sp. PH2017_22_RUC_O_B]